MLISGTSSKRKRRIGENARREQEEGGRISKKGSWGAAKKRGGTLPWTRTDTKRERRGHAKEEATRGGRAGKPNEVVG